MMIQRNFRMKHFLLALIVCPLFGFAQENWKPIENAKQDFSINTYGKTTRSIDTFVVEGSPVYIHTWNSIVEDESHPNIQYLVSSAYYPSSFIHSDSSFSILEGFLNSTMNEFLEDEEVELLTSNLDMLHGYPGKEFDFKVKSNNVHIEKRTYLIQNQLLELTCITKADKWFNTSKDEFYGSIDLKDKPKNNIDYGFTVIETPSYKVDFPGKAEEQNVFTDTELGVLNLKVNMFESKAEEGNMLYMAMETKFPETFTMEKEGLEEFYTTSINGTLQSTNSTLSHREKIEYEGFEGVEFHTSLYDGKITGIYNAIFIENTMYLQGVLSTENSKNKEAINFFDSFERIKS